MRTGRATVCIGIRIGALACALAVGACAAPTLQTPAPVSEAIQREAEIQRRYALDQARDQNIDLLRAAYRVSTAAHEFCGAHATATAGISTWSLDDFRPEDENLARNEYGVDEGLTIMAVIEDGPADWAGLMEGDRILSINGISTISMNDVRANELEADAKRTLATNGDMVFNIERDGRFQSVRITPEAACDYGIGLVQSDQVNAMADGDQIFVTSGMMNFVRSEQELALVLAHEISHNFLGHIDAQRQNAMVGLGAGFLLDVIVSAVAGINPGLYRAGAGIGAQRYSVEFEQEADYSALYILRRAGYPLEGAPELWRRMAAEDPRRITIRTSHPTSAERFVAMGTAIEEIRAKEASGQPLVPNLSPVE